MPAQADDLFRIAIRERFPTTAPHRARGRAALAQSRVFLAGVSDSMGRRLYVGNLPYSATEDQLTELFSRAGKVDNVRVMRDMATGRARGFAFVEMGYGRRGAEGHQRVPRAADGRPGARRQRSASEAGRRLWRRWRRPADAAAGGGGGGGRSYDDGDFSGGRRKEPRW